MTHSELSRQEIVDLSHQTTLYEWTVQSAMKPLVIDHAKGIYIWDADGKRYTGDPRRIELEDKRAIAIVIGTPADTIPSSFGG